MYSIERRTKRRWLAGGLPVRTAMIACLISLAACSDDSTIVFQLNPNVEATDLTIRLLRGSQGLAELTILDFSGDPLRSERIPVRGDGAMIIGLELRENGKFVSEGETTFQLASDFSWAAFISRDDQDAFPCFPCLHGEGFPINDEAQLVPGERLWIVLTGQRSGTTGIVE